MALAGIAIQPHTKTTAILVAALLLAGCSPLAFLSSTSPSSHYTRYADIAYGQPGRLRLDVYEPSRGAGDRPLVVFFYGGGWRDGAKEKYEFVASTLADEGLVVVIPDYRLYPDVRFPGFVADGAAALAWAIANAGRYGADARQVYVMGHSAGAHIAALLALDPSYLGRHELSPRRLAGVIGLSGPYDFLPLEGGYLTDVFPESLRPDSQPLRFASADAPRTLLIHGSDDTTVRVENSRRLAAALEERGVDVTLRIYAGAGHARTVAALAPPLDFLADTRADTLAFISARASDGVATFSSRHSDSTQLEETRISN